MKLIVCDLDGTLLSKTEQKLNFATTQILKKFKNKNFIFAVASGRNYIELKTIFKDFPDIYFIPDDGGHIVYKEENIFENSFSKAQLSLFDYSFVAHGKYMTFIKTEDAFFKRGLSLKYGGHIVSVNSVLEIDRPIYKVTVINHKKKYPYYEVYKNRNICEYVPDGVSKGNAVNFLMKRFSLSERNCFFFGDNYNDISMLDGKTNSYAMKHAPFEVKSVCTNVAENIIDELNNIYRRY